MSGKDGDSRAHHEYRDRGLSRLFDSDPVPQHDGAFWPELRSEISAIQGPASIPTGAVGSDGGPAPGELASDHLDQSAGGQGSDPLLDVAAIGDRRRSLMPLLIAAASVAVVGLGIAALITASNNPTTVAIADLSTTDVDRPLDSESATAATTMPEPTSSTVDGSVTTLAVLPGLPLPADYFGPATATALGTGQVVGFSPDRSAVLIVDDGPDSETGCEAAELLTLYGQDLATGIRRPVLPAGMTVQTGGMDLMVMAGELDPAGSRLVSWTDYCDGARFSAWTAVMSADGVIGEPTAVEIGGLNDPFTPSGVPTADTFGADALSVDRMLGLFVSGDGEAVVRSVGSDSEEWRLDGTAVTAGGSFDPTGQVVALPGPDVVHLWNFRSGGLASITVTGAARAMFDESGNRLAVQTFGTEPGVSLVTFSGEPPPAPMTDPVEPLPGEPSCSGDIATEPLSADTLMAQGLPRELASKVVAIDRAAGDCDWGRLSALLAEDFTASFGGGDAIELWRQSEQEQGVMGTLRTVLRQPFAVSDGDAAEVIYSWPQVFSRESCEDYTDRDRRSLAELGYSAEDIAYECDVIGGYTGYRLGIDAAGRWLYFVAGD